MAIKLHWFLPTSGDSRTVVPFGPDGHRRPATIDYLADIARAPGDPAGHVAGRRTALSAAGVGSSG